ncbi:MAG: helix-turn-helix transcriptional regulator [Chloroflexi bacterium OHK40]
MTMDGAVPERTPLSVLLFHAAMSNHKSISDFARQIDIGAISLRQFIEGNTQRPRQKTLELIGGALGMPVEEVRRRMSLSPEAAPPFGEWLQAKMTASDFSRARLTRETKISDGALRNYLSGRTLPDSDQAQKLAEVLDVPPIEVARVVIASTIAQNGGAVAPAEPQAPPQAAPEASSPAAEAPTTAALSLPATTATMTPDETTLLSLWRQLHPQGRRATFNYIAMLLAER